MSAPMIPVQQPRERCPKCNFTSGDDWKQCGGSCPMPGSPHFKPDADSRAAAEALDVARASVRAEFALHFPLRKPEVPAEQQGLFHKFVVRRTDGRDEPGCKHDGCAYFVLDLDHDEHARAALAAYAVAVEASHAALASDLRARYDLAAPVPTTWRERVDAECAELDARIRSLNALFDTPEAFAKIPPNQQRLLSAQRLAMHTYHGCLEVRLKNGDVDPYTLEPIDTLRTAAAALNKAFVDHPVAGLPDAIVRAVTDWRRTWLQVDGRSLPVGDEVQPAPPIRKAHAYERGGR